MIVYNFPFRGPFERDKTLINVLQFSNQCVEQHVEIKEKTSDLEKKVDDFIEEYSGQELIDKVYIQMVSTY